MSKTIGIDLGTTNSCVAVMDGGDARVITNADGGRTTPSMVAISSSGERLVGQIAKRQAVTNPENTVFGVKRLIGRKADASEVIGDKKNLPYAVTQADNGDVRISLKDRQYSPAEISSFILADLKKSAEAYLGEPVTDAVITVPAYFNDSQRQATKDAGKIAGLNVKRIINEPTAASLAYGLDKKKEEKIAVFDLGGGTFDVSIMEIGDGVFEVKATNGDTHLGGDDWDEVIVNWAADEFKKEQGIDLRQDRQSLQRLREAAEKAKIELSAVMETEINLPYVTADASGPKHLLLKLNRAKFEQMTNHLVERARGPFQAAIKDAKLTVDQINEVVLVGGATRMPMIQDLVRNLTNGKEPNKGVNPDEVVSIGAAIQGGVLAGDVKDILLLDVTPLSLGVETLGSVMTTLIERNTTIPVKKTETFSTAEDNQTSVDVHVLQGERPMAADNMSLGRFRLDGIPPAMRGIPQIEVTFDIDSNGILNVTAKDKATGKEQKVTITASTNLNKSDVEKMVNEAADNRAADEQRKALVELRNQGDTLAYQAEKLLKDLGDKVSAEQRTNVESKVKDLREAVQGDDQARIKTLIDALQADLQAIGQAAYQQQPDSGPQTPGGQSSDGNNEDVVEGEFTEA